jgi:hypothetical protein
VRGSYGRIPHALRPPPLPGVCVCVLPWAQVGFGERAHSFFSHGVQLACIERANDDVGDLVTAIAFARGGAVQFGGDWCLDASWWFGVIAGGANGLPASYHRRHLYTSYFAGAAVINIEGGDGLVDGTGTQPTLLGAEVQAFGRFTTLHQSDRAARAAPGATTGAPWGGTAGTAVAPVAVLVPTDSGYLTRAYWEPSAFVHGYTRLLPRVGDAGIAGFFAYVYPGSTFQRDAFPFGRFEVDNPPASPFALSAVTAPYAPRASDVFTAAPSLPFGAFTDRNAAHAALYTDPPVDPAPWRPMADTRFGDVFDVQVVGLGLACMGSTFGDTSNVVQSTERAAARARAWATTSNSSSTAPSVNGPTPGAELPVLGGYRAAVVLGPVNLTVALKASLVAFASAGGTVLVAAGVVGPGDADLTGVALEPQLRVGRSWQWVGDANVTQEPFRFTPLLQGACTPGRGCAVLATTVLGAPLAVEQVLGTGRVITCLVPWLQDATASGLSLLAQRLVDYAVSPLQPVAVAGPWPVQFGASDDRNVTGRYSVVIANHEESQWVGSVTLRQPGTYANCTDVLRPGSGPLPVRASGPQAVPLVQVTVPAFDVAVVQCEATMPVA